MKHFYLLMAALLLCLTATARATIVLHINIGDASAVVVSTTGVNADANDSGFDSSDGIILRDFLTADATLENSLTGAGNLIGGNSGDILDTFLTKPAVLSLGARDANIYSTSGNSNTQVFSTSSPAFSGTTTWDLSAISASLPASGATGDIFSGDQNGVGTAAIGQWVAVPEASAFLLVALISLPVGIVSIVNRRRRLSQV